MMPGAEVVEHHDELWKAALAKSDEIEAKYKADKMWHGSSRGAALYGSSEVSTILDIGQEDGTHHVFLISASIWARTKKIEVKVRRYFHNSDDYWESQIEAEPERRVVVDGIHYRLGKNGNKRGEFQGFGGRRWQVEFFDGRTVVTYDLWCQGKIPPVFRDRLPDNARFVFGEEPRLSVFDPEARP